MAANSPKIDIFWSPSKPDNYIVFGSELSLYKIDNIPSVGEIPSGTKISETTYSRQLLTNSDNLYPKCMAWYPKIERDYLVAVGLANGTITLTSLDPKKNDIIIGNEYVPQHCRPCFCLAWSPDNQPYLAAGLDKYRTDPSLLIFDVNTSNATDKSTGVSTEKSKFRILHELGQSEPAFSLAWSTVHTVVTGLNKYLRVFDIRSIKNNIKTTGTKAVYGVCVDEEKVASYVESQVYVWDLRRFDKPEHVIQLQKDSVVKLAWCPKRTGLLGCLTKDGHALRVFDIKHAPIGQDDDQSYNERLVDPEDGVAYASFDWHPFEENRLLTINVHGGVKDHRLFERISIDMGPYDQSQKLFYSNVRKYEDYQYSDEHDIAAVMRRRAEQKYGLQTAFMESDWFLELHPQSEVYQLWNWVSHTNYLLEHDKLFSTQDAEHIALHENETKFRGMLHILKDVKSQEKQCHWTGIDSRQQPVPLRHYVNYQREKCLKICKWPTSLNGVKEMTEDLKSHGLYEKATVMALFYGDMSEALNILHEGAQCRESAAGINLSIVAMALAGVSNSRDTLWLTKCKELRNKIFDPHLRAAFTFLTCETNYREILDEAQLSVADRVAFACLFLPDSRLVEYLKDLQDKVVSEGNLYGIILTGLELAGVDLLQHYIDRTGDIQTAAIVMMHSYPNSLSREERVAGWIDHYRELMDKWKFWILRAEFDIFMKKKFSGHETIIQAPPPVHLSCNFCKKPIIPTQIQHRRLYNGYGPNSNTVKVTICQECRKPLSRCSLCLKNMGTAAGFYRAVHNHDNQLHKERKNTEFKNWFTWCQSCHHGGHSQHIEEWFRSNIECPVTGCTCKCTTLDSMPPLKYADGYTAQANNSTAT